MLRGRPHYLYVREHDAMIKIGKTARKLREAKGLTQKAAAEALGISQVHLSNIENNKSYPSKELLDRSPRAGGLGYNELVFGSWSPELLPALVQTLPFVAMSLSHRILLPLSRPFRKCD